MRNILIYGLLLVFTACSRTPVHVKDRQLELHEPNVAEVQASIPGEQLGTVRIPASCQGMAIQHVARGVALLHHMTYEDARTAFTTATKVDPECAMGYWGQAMTFIHPLWSDPPSEADFNRGKALVNEARARGHTTDREQAYIAAVEAYYAEGWNPDEKANLAGFEKGWERVHHQFPEDPEAACFYALTHMATADPEDKTYTKQRRAGAIAEEVLTRVPDHPGAHHYLIHAYDYPPLAEEALEVARSYGNIAPEIPHALHMPSHIFTRLGLWDESIEWNKRSAAAALKSPVNGAISFHYLHALDYLAYAYLQRAEDQKAKQVLDIIKTLDDPIQAHGTSSYTLAAVPARIALERQQWSDAAQLKPGMPDDYPWDRFPAQEAITHFARALGAARSGQREEANQALEELETLRNQAAKTSDYWANQIEIQRLSAMAWLLYHENKHDKTLETMQKAAEMEDMTEKHPITPGEVLPARELLADMLFEMGRYKEAREEYSAALERNANRFNSLYGAGRAAELEDNKDEATFYYKQLVAVTANADTPQKRLQQAKAFLEED